MKGESIDLFANDGSMVGLDPVGMSAKEKGYAFFVGGSSGFGVFSDSREGFVDRFHRNGALGDID